MNSGLTLICPTFNRHYYLSRSINFWSGRDGVNVIYADGSTTPFDKDRIFSDNIKYYYRPEGFKERVIFLMNQVKTPYMCLLCDDEFFIPSSLESCVKYLNAHPDYVACMGRALGFTRFNDEVIFRSQYPELNGRSLSSESPFSRLNDHFSEYVPAHCYAVTRTDAFVRSMSYALDIQLDVFAIFELVEEFLIVSKGKTCILPYLHWLRSYEVPPIRNTGDCSLNPNKPFKQWWQSEDASLVSEKLDFCSRLALSTDGAINYQQVVEILDSYLENTYKKQIASQSWMRYAMFKVIKAASLQPIVHLLKIARSFGAKRIRHFSNSSVRNHFLLKELLDQDVIIDESGLSECLYTIKSC